MARLWKKERIGYLKQIETIIFDFDGTICDSLLAGFEIANRLSTQYKFKKVNSAELPLYRNMHSKQVLKSLGISYFKLPRVAKKFRELLNIEIANLKPFDNIVDEIKWLHNKGYQLGVLSSNSNENVQQFLINNDIAHCFSFLKTGTSLFGKPTSIRKLLKKQRLLKHEVLLVGDETRDIEAAHRCKIKVLAVTWGFHTRDLLMKFNPDYCIDSPTEISELVQSI